MILVACLYHHHHRRHHHHHNHHMTLSVAQTRHKNYQMVMRLEKNQLEPLRKEAVVL
jgi:hypothetical protein